MSAKLKIQGWAAFRMWRRCAFIFTVLVLGVLGILFLKGASHWARLRAGTPTAVHTAVATCAVESGKR
jgi:hypothetical protein